MSKKTYRKKDDQPIIAIQLDLDTDGLVYQKWGAEQRGKKLDWVVNNGGEVYTIDRESFDSTYEKISPGLYRKIAVIYAEKAEEAGSVETKEGKSHYVEGDYIVSNKADGSDAYCISADKFAEMYEEVPGE
jgi:PHD/YefM family antitoxin component YafN of YafNO toxin-antitoxin module